MALIKKPELVLFQPDIPQNCGTMLRLCACLDVNVHIIEPCGFIWDDRKLRRAGMDYLNGVTLGRHASWPKFLDRASSERRLVLLTTKADSSATAFDYSVNDLLIAGSESAGVPEEIHRRVDARIKIPMIPNTRSLNVATAVAIVLGEALRQLDAYPAPLSDTGDQNP